VRVLVFIATERGNQRDFYHAFKHILSALPQRISGTFSATVMKSLVKVKVNVSLCKTKIDVKDWSCISMYISSRFYIKVNGLLHAPVALPPRKKLTLRNKL
jgi:hypothetical protein